ncbi:hybrid sensor histidine kinase/response regulator transcription factor [uncultured Maribacter sp.]|uniref:hybrid sensor histidine kinase/response regulator transcription factor n=1 Tax=uncultured Maribacter sp. TaxID=431308 RepID=UPI002620B11F|nr:hybrid sensor histidine kinase/response regulator transcription factor [uncultured Maribacter sp.]
MTTHKYFFILFYVLLLFYTKAYNQKFIDNYEITPFKLPIETTAHDILEDSYGFLWIATTNGLWRYDGNNFKSYIKNENDKTSITDNHISCLYEDKKNTLWVGTYGGGLLKYDRNCDCFEQYIHKDKDPKSLSFNEIKTIFETKDSTFYIGTDGGGLNIMNRQDGSFKSFKHNTKDSTSVSHNNILSIEEIADGKLAIGTWIGLNIFNPKTQKFKQLFKSPLKGTQYHHRLAYYNGKLLTASKEFYTYSENKFSLLSISNGTAYGVKKINDENCWFLNRNKIIITDFDLKTKQQINLQDVFNTKKDYLLTRIYHNVNNNSTWLLDRFGAFFLIEKKTSPFTPFIKENFKGDISKTNTNFWVSKDNAIYIIDKENSKNYQKLKRTFFGKPYIATQGKNTIWVADNEYYYEFNSNGILLQQIQENIWPFAALQTKDNQLWIGEVLGASNYNIQTKKNVKFKCDWNLPNGIGYFHKVYVLFEDSKNCIWIGTEGDGLKKYNPKTKKFTHYRHKIGDKTTLNNNFVHEIFEDNENNLWIGTKAGLCRLDKKTDTFIQSENPIIKDKIILSIEQDANSILWIGTLNGLLKYDYKNNKIRVLNEQDGVLSHKIGTSSLPLKNGHLVFNTNKGLMIFNPEDVKESNKSPKIYLSKLWVNNEIIKPNSKYISKNIEIENQINLEYSDKKFEIEFHVINYNNNGRCKFAYKLDGYDKSWSNVQDNQKATYTNIPSGEYTFMVKGSNEHGVWSNKIKEITITITPPFWELLWVKMIGLLLAILFFALILRFVIKKERNRAKFEIEKDRVFQFEEVAKMKLKFFTNISHELRTPLTLITSPLDKYTQENIKPSNKVLEMMHRNSSRLLELVNQILDYRKLEGNQKLQITTQKDLSVFNNINASSHYWSKEKNIHYNNTLPEDKYELFFDADVLEKIVTNLMSNAFKYTPKEGTVQLLVKLKDIEAKEDGKVSNGFMEIHVIDNGSGIPIEYQEKVFERFYQLGENADFGYSSGIGLSLTAELVKLHKGNIELKSSKEKGCHFKVEIPIGHQDYEGTYTKKGDELPEINTDKTLVLIVEDNDDIRNYINDELKETYQIIEAENGKTGLKLAIATLPDVIISDIMMPESDGIQLANQLKSNELTSHIPLLFLTAKTGIQNKITGLTTGAEDYIQKPFNISEIKLKIKNVIDGRNQLLKKFTQENLGEFKKTNSENTDKYLEKVNLELEKHLENSDFSVDQLCSELAIGRSQLYRKIQALTGKSIIEYINFHRLSTAMILIKEGRYTLKEIAYKIGYNDNRYFSRAFKKEFGNPPSLYIPKKKA